MTHGRPDHHPERRAAIGKIKHREGYSGEFRWRLDQSRCRRLRAGHAGTLSAWNWVTAGWRASDIEGLVPQLYAALYKSIAAHSRLGLNVVADVGHHDAYSKPLNCLVDCARRLAGLPVLLVGVRCPIEIIMERRAASAAGKGYITGSPDDPMPLPVRSVARSGAPARRIRSGSRHIASEPDAVRGCDRRAASARAASDSVSETIRFILRGLRAVLTGTAAAGEFVQIGKSTSRKGPAIV